MKFFPHSQIEFFTHSTNLFVYFSKQNLYLTPLLSTILQILIPPTLMIYSSFSGRDPFYHKIPIWASNILSKYNITQLKYNFYTEQLELKLESGSVNGPYSRSHKHWITWIKQPSNPISWQSPFRPSLSHLIKWSTSNECLKVV